MQLFAPLARQARAAPTLRHGAHPKITSASPHLFNAVHRQVAMRAAADRVENAENAVRTAICADGGGTVAAHALHSSATIMKSLLSQSLLGPVAVSVLGFSLLGVACDSDDDTTGTGGTGGSAGRAGKGGSAGIAGRSGASNGGSGGTVGNMAGEGGNPAGEAGMPGGGEGANPGTGGTGNDAGGAGAGGESEGGAAGSGATGGADDGPSVLRPERRDVSEARINGLSVKSGFELNVFASNLGNARMLATHGADVYVTRTLEGDVLRLPDADANGVADAPEPVVPDLPDVHGIAFNGDQVYLATIHSVYRGTVNSAGGFDDVVPIITDLPDGGQHYRRTLGVGPDSLLYISVGSTCDACPDSNPENATLLQANLDGTGRVVFASGLRNTIGFDWHPDTAELWGMDHGSDMRGNDVPPEELNHLAAGLNYGWPYCFGDRTTDPIIDDPPGTTKAAYCAATQPPALPFQAHQAPIGMTFYTGTAFPERYQGDAFVAFHGSWNREPAVGYKVVHISFEGGQPQAAEDFVSGFLIENGTAYFGRPAGITVAADGALLFSDDENGFVYRIAPAP